MLIDVVHDPAIAAVPNGGLVNVDASALASKSPGNVVYFSDRYESGGVTTPVHAFVLSEALLPSAADPVTFALKPGGELFSSFGVVENG